MPCWGTEPPASGGLQAARRLKRLQAWRRVLQAGFFALFLLAPALDLLRFDLHEAQLWLLGQRWTLGIAAFQRGEIGANQVALGMLWRGLLPLALLVAVFLGVAWRWGRVYCGWMCPHFSLVEALNHLLWKASGRLSLWDRERQPGAVPRGVFWPVFVGTALLFGGLWAVTLLSYLLPPAEVWGGLVHGQLTPGPQRFLVVAWILFSAELLFARHLFCRFGCAVGLFQSLAWMANPRAWVVAFQRDRAPECRACQPQADACESACPMRLRPRTVKRQMFSCVQCGRCLQACAQSHQRRGAAPSLHWAVGVDALREDLRRRRQAGGRAATAKAAPVPKAAQDQKVSP